MLRAVGIFFIATCLALCGLIFAIMKDTSILIFMGLFAGIGFLFVKSSKNKSQDTAQSDLSEKAQTSRQEQSIAQKNNNSGNIKFVVSYSGTGEVYEVDTTNLTCSCPDWHKRRKHIRMANPKRLCKHLIQAMSLDEMKRYPDRSGTLKYCRDMQRGYPLD